MEDRRLQFRMGIECILRNVKVKANHQKEEDYICQNQSIVEFVHHKIFKLINKIRCTKMSMKPTSYYLE